MKNRRRTKRASTSLRGHITTGGKRVRAQIRNLSEDGALLLLDIPLMEGTEIEIDFNLKKEQPSGSDEPVHTSATVIWCNEDLDCGYQSGIQFSPGDSDAKKILTRFFG